MGADITEAEVESEVFEHADAAEDAEIAATAGDVTPSLNKES